MNVGLNLHEDLSLSLLPDFEPLWQVEENWEENEWQFVELNVLLCEQIGGPQLAEETDADVPLETEMSNVPMRVEDNWCYTWFDDAGWHNQLATGLKVIKSAIQRFTRITKYFQSWKSIIFFIFQIPFSWAFTIPGFFRALFRKIWRVRNRK